MIRKSLFSTAIDKGCAAVESKYAKRVLQLLADYDIPFERKKCVAADSVSVLNSIYVPSYNFYVNCNSSEVGLICKDSPVFALEEGNEERVIKSIIEFIRSKNSSAFDIQTELFNKCRECGFPQPVFTAVQLRNSWNSLCKYSADRLVPRASVGNIIVKNFHPSLYDVHVGACPSVREAWFNDELLKKVILNRHVYVDPEHLTCDRMLQGFNISKVAPRASVFAPCWARYLTDKYLAEFDEVFDSFSGFSGRLLGVCSLGKKYIGQDLSKTHVQESHNLISAMHLQNCYVQVKNVLESSGSYQCLLTCPPYDNKEVYESETVFNACDEWIDECLSRFNCNKYVFVVDSTKKYLDYVVEDMSHVSYMSNAKEKVVVIDKGSL